jgi:uncharacterized protein (TIGR02246 family)
MTPAMDSAREETAIQKQFETFVAAWNRHDPRAMSETFAEDADLINPFGRAARGRSQIETLFKDEHSGSLKDTRFSLKPEGVRFVAPNTAVTDHSFEVTGARDRAGNDVTIRGHLTNVLKKDGDTWRVVASRPMIPAPRPDAR